MGHQSKALKGALNGVSPRGAQWALNGVGALNGVSPRFLDFAPS